MNPNLNVDFVGIKFNNPVIVSSGTFGYGFELEDLIDICKLGGIITKTITLEPRHGNPQPRIAEVSSGIVNNIGLQNVGIVKFVEKYLKKIIKFDIPVIVSISGKNVCEYIKIIEILNKQDCISAVELNLSCPNLNESIICNDLDLVYNIITGIKQKTKIPLIAKLSPSYNILEIALIAQKAGVDGLTIANTYPAMVVNVDIYKKFNVMFGGLSGPSIKPISIRYVYDVYKKVDIPIIGCGGIMNGNDAIEFLASGSKLVSVGTACLISPNNLINIIEEIELILKKNKIKSINEIIGICNKK
ncbi:MAG: dihydroorotate dehydrogenase [Endomicrobium sp.]|jgi:dihydroorotate dehydrogenase (NAD+) catalytic subunit|nr:dihydroorotate dehydrogenase [Endomicrobium sp.]